MGKSDWIFCKWLNFSPVKFFPDFFSPDKEFISIFFSIIIIIITIIIIIIISSSSIISYIFSKFIITMFFYILYLSWLSKVVLTKTLKCKWKQAIEKNNNNNDINTTRNCTLVNFKNYTTSKTSKRIDFKLVLIISGNKGRVLNSFKDFVWFSDHLCYPRWFKAIQNQITAPSQVLVHLIDPFCV